MNQKELMKKFEKDLETVLSATIFPKEKISEGFNSLVLIALRTKSALELSIRAETYQQLVQQADATVASPEWNLYTISYALNAVNGSTPYELGLGLYDYSKVMSENQKMMDLWHEMVEPIKKEVSERNQPKMPATSHRNSNVIPIGKNGRKNRR